jgi:hypothetical protein
MSANGSDGVNNCDNAASGMGCLTMHHAKGQLTVTRKYIKMEPSATAYDTRNNDDRVEFNGNAQSAYIIGTGARLRRIGIADGHVIEVTSGAVITIDGLTISSATGPAGHGLLCSASSTLDLRRVTVSGNAGLGLSSNDCTVRISRSTISGNVGGGASLMGGSFNIVNNFIVSNGNITTSFFGGIRLQSSVATNSFEFNTKRFSGNAGRWDHVHERRPRRAQQHRHR